MTEQSAKEIFDFLLPQIQSESKITRKVLAAAPDEKLDYKPSEKCMTGIELAIHIAAAEAFFLNGVLDGAFDWKQPELAKPSDVVAWYDANVLPLVDKIGSLPAASLAKDVDFMGMMKAPAVFYLNMHMMHNAHHRGQLTSYLRPMGGKVPSIYGGSADEPMGTAEHA